MMPFSSRYTLVRMDAPAPSLVTVMLSYHLRMSSGRMAVMALSSSIGFKWSRRYWRYLSLVVSSKGLPSALRRVSTYSAAYCANVTDDCRRRSLRLRHGVHVPLSMSFFSEASHASARIHASGFAGRNVSVWSLGCPG